MAVKGIGMNIKTWAAVFSGLAAATLSGPSLAADVNLSFPSTHVQMIVPGAAGSSIDVLGRIVGRKLAAIWNQPVVVENVVGASGNIGHAKGVRARPDGHTILMGLTGPMSIAPSLEKRPSFDPVRDLEPVILLARLPNILVVNNAVPASNLQEFIEYAKQNPRKVRYGHPGLGTSPHLTAEEFNAAAGTDILGISYSSSSQMTTDLVGGHIELMFHNAPTVLPLIRQGTLRGLGISSARRNAAAPNLPSLAEAGLSGFEVIAWCGFYVPAKTPKPVIQKLNRDIAAVLKDAEVRQWMNDQAGEAGGGSPEDLAQFQMVQTAKWRAIIESRGLKRP